MKLLIYIILFTILLIYINDHSKKITNEEFSDGFFDDINNYQAVNPYDLINVDVFKKFPDDSSDFVVAYNENPYYTNEKPYYANQLNKWILSNSDYSDIFNGQDSGGNQINKIISYCLSGHCDRNGGICIGHVS